MHPHPLCTPPHTKLLPHDQFAVSSSYFSILLISMYFQKFCLKLLCQLFPEMSFPKVTFSHFFLEADWPYEYTFHKQWNWGFHATTGRGVQHAKCRSTGKALLGNGRYLHLDLRMSYRKGECSNSSTISKLFHMVCHRLGSLSSVQPIT